MPTAADSRDERMELERVLASGVFARAPILAQLLTYVCDKYFEGAVGDIKEYNIAVEALGRAPDFNQKKDSIVRVEAHRLRKRLQAYYRNEGATHAIRIEIPPGHYAPHFVHCTPVPPASPEASAVALPARPASNLIDTGADGTTDSRSL